MKLRLGSVAENGFGSNTGAISLMYSYLLNKYKLGVGNHVFINHIGNELEEVIIKQKKEFAVNIRWPLPDDFDSVYDVRRNKVFMDIIHEGLLRLSRVDETIKPTVLELIKNELESHEFAMELVYKNFINANNKNISAKVIISPAVKYFDFYIQIDKNETPVCKYLIYQGIPTDFYLKDLFFSGKWDKAGKFVLKGKRSEVEFHLEMNTCRLELINTNKIIGRAPVFNLFRFDAGAKELEEYISSLNPAIAAIISQSQN